MHWIYADHTRSWSSSLIYICITWPQSINKVFDTGICTWSPLSNFIENPGWRNITENPIQSPDPVTFTPNRGDFMWNTNWARKLLPMRMLLWQGQSLHAQVPFVRIYVRNKFWVPYNKQQKTSICLGVCTCLCRYVYVCTVLHLCYMYYFHLDISHILFISTCTQFRVSYVL